MYSSMENMQSVKSILCLLLLTILMHLSMATVDKDGRKIEVPELPQIWSEKSIGRDESELSYKFSGQIQLADSDKWYLFEEWGSLTKKKFRFDLLEAPVGKRRTFLAYEETGENFVYQPFTCSLVENFNDELYKDLKNKFAPSQKDQLLSTGIGSIWAHAERLEQTYVAPKNSVSRNDPSAMKAIKRLEDLRKYTVEPTADYPYRVNFYFQPDKMWVEARNLVLIRLTDSSNKVVMVVTMLGYEPIPQLNPSRRIDEGDIFDLPIGYGCQRRTRPVDSFAEPIDILGNREHPQILRLDIVSLQPQNVGDDMEKWKTHSMSVKMVSGRLSLDLENRDYLMLETQEYAPGQGQDEFNSANSCLMDGSKTNRATMRRLRRVWDLGADGLTGGQDSPAVYFAIDERRARCLGFGEVEAKDAADIQFPVGYNTKGEDNGTGANQYRVPGLILNNELLGLAFGSTYDFQLIREFSQGRLKEFINERRQLDFKLRDRRGKELWSGPVSIIKRQSMSVNDFGRAKKQSPLEVSSSVTIQFLSQDLEKLVSKITITLADKQPISGAALHRELNIATLCYGHESWPEAIEHQQEVPVASALPIERWNYKGSEKKWTNLEISLTYPIECDASIADGDESTTRPPSSLISNNNNNNSPGQPSVVCSRDSLKRFLASSRLAEPVIYEQFLSSLFRTMRGRLDPIQLSQVGVLMSPQLEAVRVSAKLVARPSLLAFNETPKQRFARARWSHIHAELKPNRIACADSCQHLNCTAFAYCPFSNECDLSLDDEDNIYDEDRLHLLYEPDATCSVFKVARGRQTNIMSPQEVVQELKRLVEEEPRLLELRLQEMNDQGRLVNTFQLRPQRLESGDLLAENDLFNAAELDQVGDNERMNVVEEDGKDLVEIEYEIVALNRNYRPTDETKTDFPIKLAKQASYQDCESLCNELDCQSFSHCQLEQTCQVSQLRKGKAILKASVAEDFCHIFARDYLSKFTRNLKLESGRLLVDLDRSLNVANVHDCALHCMEEPDFKCRSFYACSEMAPTGGSHRTDVDCHLRGSHLSGAAAEIRADSEQVMHSAGLRPGVTCHLYTRSYLAEFDRFYGRALVDDSQIADGSTRTALFLGIEAEACGLECAERAGLCWAFQVCRPQAKSGARRGPICALSLIAEAANQSSGSSPPGSAAPSARDRLVANERCTTFVVSAGSELASLLVRDELAKAHLDETSAGRAARWGFWPQAMVVLLAGLALGLAAGRLQRSWPPRSDAA